MIENVSYIDNVNPPFLFPKVGIKTRTIRDLTYLGLLCGPESEEDGEVLGEVPAEGLSEGQEEVAAGPDQPGVAAAPADAVEGGRRRLEVTVLAHGEGVDGACTYAHECF